GFPIATALLTMVIGILFNASLPAAGISGVVLGILLWYAFDRLLDVTLPLGAWFN
ncbi:tripartite tricarboxylate transporter TctB family protein, partial [Enterobacter hormaechei]